MCVVQGAVQRTQLGLTAVGGQEGSDVADEQGNLLSAFYDEAAMQGRAGAAGNERWSLACTDANHHIDHTSSTLLLSDHSGSNTPFVPLQHSFDSSLLNLRKRGPEAETKLEHSSQVVRSYIAGTQPALMSLVHHLLPGSLEVPAVVVAARTRAVGQCTSFGASATTAAQSVALLPLPHFHRSTLHSLSTRGAKCVAFGWQVWTKALDLRAGEMESHPRVT